jgi:hypothetical protein
LIAVATAPDVDSTHDVVVIDQVDDAVVNDIVLVGLQDGVVICSDVEKSWLKTGIPFRENLFFYPSGNPEGPKR